MKTIFENDGYIDYKAEKFGVRVRLDSCQPIRFQGGRWITYDARYSLPLRPHVIEMHTADRRASTPLSRNVADYEQYRLGELDEDNTELRCLLLGWVGSNSVV